MIDRLFVSLFSGAGGLDLGLEQAGWRCVYASDIDPVAVGCLSANQGRLIAEGVGFLDDAVVECRDIRGLAASAVYQATGLTPGRVELLAGGPPCQAWSSAGLQLGFEDPRGQVAREFVRLASELRPRWLVMENVRGLLTARDSHGHPGGALTFLRASLREIGYQTSVQLLNAADFGVPQRRVRLFIIGFTVGDEPRFPTPTHARQRAGQLSLLPRWVPLGEALEQVPPGEIILPSERLARELAVLVPGTGLKSPGKRESTRPGGHWGYTQGRFLADLQQPARTVTASSQQDWIDDPDFGVRRLSPRECAAIQTFPLDWALPVGRTEAYRLVGNAVPPTLARVLGGVLLAEPTRRFVGSPPPAPLDGLQPLPLRLEAAIRYTAKEDARNGESRRSVPDRRGRAAGLRR